MKNIVLITLILLTFKSYSQNNITEYASKKSIQFAVIPGVIYNSISLGFGIKKQNVENTFEINSYYIPIGGARFAVGVHYNRNYYLKNDKTFIPVWGGVNRINVDNNYEDGGPYYDKMNFRLGSGIGTNISLKNSHKIRFEFGIGAALHLENKESYDNESPFPYKFALNNFSISESYPVIPSVRIKIRYILPLNN